MNLKPLEIALGTVGVFLAVVDIFRLAEKLTAFLVPIGAAYKEKFGEIVHIVGWLFMLLFWPTKLLLAYTNGNPENTLVRWIALICLIIMAVVFVIIFPPIIFYYIVLRSAQLLAFFPKGTVSVLGLILGIISLGISIWT